jgi:hypothetical protein
MGRSLGARAQPQGLAVRPDRAGVRLRRAGIRFSGRVFLGRRLRLFGRLLWRVVYFLLLRCFLCRIQIFHQPLYICVFYGAHMVIEISTVTVETVYYFFIALPHLFR